MRNCCIDSCGRGSSSSSGRMVLWSSCSKQIQVRVGFSISLHPFLTSQLVARPFVVDMGDFSKVAQIFLHLLTNHLSPTSRGLMRVVARSRRSQGIPRMLSVAHHLPAYLTILPGNMMVTHNSKPMFSSISTPTGTFEK